MKKITAFLLSLVMVCSLALPAMAADNYSDVAENDWFAEAARGLRDREIMNGVGNNRFGPDAAFTRAALATVLYRMAGSPAVTGEDGFTDTSSGTWYSDAVLWASQNKVVNGVGGGRYGTDSAATQEQLVTMLWRHAGEYVVDNTEETGASSWAVNAVRWAKAEGLINENGPAFAQTEAASRAQVADIVYRYLLLKEKYADVDAVSGATKKADEQAEPQEGTAGGKTLIAYFSRTGENYNVGTITEGNTAKLAKEIAAQTGGTLFEIEPVTVYPDAYSEMLTIATNERQSNARPEIKNKVENFEQYDTIFIGYPIWWGDLPMILHSFMESYDFTGKTVIPFNTHEGSGQAGTQSTITGKLTGATVLRGLAMQGSTAQKLSGDGSNASVKNWLEGLGFGK